MIHLLDSPIENNEVVSPNGQSSSSPHIHSVTSDDGKIWGPFDSFNASQEWLNLYSRHRNRVFTARDVYEGGVCGEGMYLISATALEFGLHPFTEIYDTYSNHDNGRVVVSLPSNVRAIAGNVALLIDTPIPSPPNRQLPNPLMPPMSANLTEPYKSVPAQNGGDIVIFGGDNQAILIGWRRDTRFSKDIQVISRHDLMEVASLEAKVLAKTFVPPKRRKSTRLRDSQRQLVYTWEDNLGIKVKHFDNIEECQNLADKICSDIGLRGIKVVVGRASLDSHSYFNKRGNSIVLASHMLNDVVVVHEMAHYVTSRFRKLSEASHGPVFVGILSALYSKYLNVNIDHAFEKALASGIEFDERRGRKFLDMLEGKSVLKP